MKKMKKVCSVALAALMSLQIVALSACGGEENAVKAIETYQVTTSASVGGSVTASVAEVEQGQDVMFTITPADGYMLESLTINGGKVTVAGNTYVFVGTICDLNVKANFIKPDVSVLFDLGEGVEGEAVESVLVKYGKTFGELPRATAKGKRFLHWENEKGEQVRATTIVSQSGEIMLKAVWEDVTEAEKEKLVPFGATTAYYDMAATKYGVVFHTDGEPITPQIMVAKNGEGDFTDAAIFSCDYEPWFSEYVINGVVEGLEFDTEYSVKFGDASADVWCTILTRAHTPRSQKAPPLSVFSTLTYRDPCPRAAAFWTTRLRTV